MFHYRLEPPLSAGGAFIAPGKSDLEDVRRLGLAGLAAGSVTVRPLASRASSGASRRAVQACSLQSVCVAVVGRGRGHRFADWRKSLSRAAISSGRKAASSRARSGSLLVNSLSKTCRPFAVNDTQRRPSAGWRSRATKPAAFQQQQHRPHRVGVRADAPDQLLLRHRVGVGQGGEQHELVGRHAVLREAGVGLAVQGQIGGPQCPGDLAPGCHGIPVAIVYVHERKPWPTVPPAGYPLVNKNLVPEQQRRELVEAPPPGLPLVSRLR